MTVGYGQYMDIFNDIHQKAFDSLKFMEKDIFPAMMKDVFELGDLKEFTRRIFPQRRFYAEIKLEDKVDANNPIITLRWNNKLKKILLPEFAFSDATPMDKYYEINEMYGFDDLKKYLLEMKSDDMVQKNKLIVSIIDQLIRFIDSIINNRKYPCIMRVSYWKNVMNMMKTLITFLENRENYNEVVGALNKFKECLKHHELIEDKIGGIFEAPGKITLYIKNISDCENEKKFSENLSRIILHEMVHYIHYQFITLARGGAKYYWSYEKEYRLEMDTVVECLAKWTEYVWLCSRPSEQFARITILNELSGRFYPFYPYAAARVYIECNDRPWRMFMLSAVSWEKAYQDILDVESQKKLHP